MGTEMVRRADLPLGIDCAFPPPAYHLRRKPLTAKITQPYPAGALRKAAKAAVFTSSLPNAVWQLHFSYPAGALHPASSAAADYAATGIFTAKRSLATSHFLRYRPIAAVTPLRSYTAQPVNSDSPADSGWAFG